MATRGEPKAHRLYLMRHAEAATTGTDWRDISRELTPRGRTQAREVGELLARQRVELVLSSSAARAKQTTELLSLPAPIRYVDRLYNAGSRALLSELSGIPDQVRTVLVVGHAPGIPALAENLADRLHSSPEALALIRYNYPPATLVGLEFFGGWSALAEARLFSARHA
ncbi:MAG TPA: histidine phosphatase family protein [Propionicimonas sp.]|jgi:phosphohistidine phosphatase|uniref:SixA phosphatase family protein n=1 Tax=Propionicimonas sp. TaxID=1955623 RepID=UPI002F3FCB7A